MIGDGLGTDIAGAAAAGLDSAFVVSGIAGERLGVSFGELPEPEKLAEFLQIANAQPRYVIPGLIW